MSSPLPPIPIAADRHDRLVWEHLKRFEGVIGRIYTDCKGVPTMGTGIALAVSGPAGWRLRPWGEIGAEISGDSAQPYVFTLEERQRLLQCLRALGQGDVPGAQALIPPFDSRRETPDRNRFGFTLDDSRMRAMALTKWEPARRAVLGDILAEATAQGYGLDEAKRIAAGYVHSAQEVGLASVRFNIGIGRPTPKASRALVSGERATLWFEIACNTNPPSNGAARPGIAWRRLAEARLACGHPSIWNSADQAALQRLLANKADAMAAYRRAVPGVVPTDPCAEPDLDPPPGGASARPAIPEDTKEDRSDRAA
ncbi:hypothetical protein CU669_01615 [Paramagnetospirillum kuznetsovii]|uniref:Uncharacterized protein n=1 Tax=Paramagnetospirillum kuznetsovii TaxID=2053833 RepID=A0A364P3B4_9PROT|nr:hypothetical protein [Paramagnetospirillum kuznetsovii]RAU23813.1 hypothetical protein CU669_01615 [Paramagnetospirillum kuznetsovii]